MHSELIGKSERLVDILSELEAAVVAYSGGVDSSLLAVVAHEVLGGRSLAVTAVSPSLARRERRDAQDLARRCGFDHQMVETHEVERAEYARNDSRRCYWCKTELFEVLEPIAARRRASILVGTNLDDLDDYRPGLRAAAEHEVRAPLAEAGLTKADVRALSAERGLDTADKPASPCLASRFAYGVVVTTEGLRRIDAAEEAIRTLGFGDFRVRDHGDLARLEVPAAEIERAAALAETISARLGELGYSYVALDLRGYRSGAMNEVLFSPRMRGA